MGILNIRRRGEADDERSADAEPTEAENDGRRLSLSVLVGLVGGAALALYLHSRRRAVREAEFTEIELEPDGAESESASTE